jgi:hypothetical protein
MGQAFALVVNAKIAGTFVTRLVNRTVAIYERIRSADNYWYQANFASLLRHLGRRQQAGRRKVESVNFSEMMPAKFSERSFLINVQPY